MPTINVQPLVLRDVIMTIAGNDYQAACSEVTITPTAQAIQWKGLARNTHQSMPDATWAAAITFAQDWDTTGALSAYLMDNEGSAVSVTFKPRAGGGASFTTTLVITPGAIGGKVDTFGETSVTLPATKPVRSSGVAVIPTTTAATPTNPVVAGGTLLKITGTSFLGATAVAFDAVNAPQFRVDSDTVIYVVAPAHAAGAAVVKVTNAVGQSTVNTTVTYA